MPENEDRGLDQAALEALFPAIAEALDAVPPERRTTVMTKAFLLLAHRTAALDDALVALAQAPEDPRPSASQSP